MSTLGLGFLSGWFGRRPTPKKPGSAKRRAKNHRRERRFSGGYYAGRPATHYLPNIRGCRYSDEEGLTYHGIKVMNWYHLLRSNEARIRAAVDNVRFADAMVGGPA